MLGDWTNLSLVRLVELAGAKYPHLDWQIHWETGKPTLYARYADRALDPECHTVSVVLDWPLHGDLEQCVDEMAEAIATKASRVKKGY